VAVEGYFNQDCKKLRNQFDTISPHYSKLLTAFIDYLQHKNIEVIFFISPYHPLVYNHFQNAKEYKIIIETEKFYTQLAKDKNIKIVGTYNPAKLGLSNSAFYDGPHCKYEALQSIWK